MSIQALATLIVAAVVSCLAVFAPSGAGAATLCDEQALYAVLIPGCAEEDSVCVVSEEVVCNSTCPGNCVYNLGTNQKLLVKSIGSAHGKFTGTGRSVTIKAKAITTDSDTTRVRFSGDVTLDTSDASHGVSDDDPDIDIVGKVEGGDVTIVGGKVKVGSITAPGRGVSVSGTATDDHEGTLEVTGTIDVSVNSGWEAAGWMLLTGARTTTINGNLRARQNGNVLGEVGTGTIRVASGFYGTPTITINSPLSANSTAGTSHGGVIFVERFPYWIAPPPHPDIFINASMEVDAQGNGYNGGEISIVGNKIDMSSGTLEASGTGSSSVGGEVVVKAYAPDEDNSLGTPVLFLNEVTARGGQGGTVDVQALGDVWVTDTITVTALDQPPRTGGAVYISPLVGEDPPCGQQVTVEGDVLAHGHGSSGVGGTISIESPSFFMNGFVSRKLNADSKPSSPTTGTGGTISLRASDDTPGLVLYKGNNEATMENWQTITALPGGSIATSDHRHGGNFTPTGTTDLDPLDCVEEE